jgi:ribosome biogenesis ATPase
VPDVTWEDIGALETVRGELQLAILEPIRNSEKYTQLGLTAPSGVLLYGPPGCGKTLLAKAIANDSGANFISVKGPELLNKFVGESERAVRQVFARAQASAPCVIFFDELDALAPKRSNDSNNASAERVVNQLLTEMDGVESRRNVFVIAATNRPDIIDPAMLRPGRLDKMLFVPLPNETERAIILKTCARKTPTHDNVDLSVIAKKTEFFSGADLSQVVKEAAISCLKENLKTGSGLTVEMRHFEDALSRVGPSVTQHERRTYEKLNSKFRPLVVEKNTNPSDAMQS